MKKGIVILSLFSQFFSYAEEGLNTNDIASKNNQFAFKLYNEIAIKNEDGNIFISPFSISTALAMTYAGAKGETEKEMAKTMFFDTNTEEFHTAYGAYIQKLLKNAEGNIEMNVANRLWGQETYEILNSFLEINQKAYQSPLVKLNFKDNPEKSRLTINKWVADQTNQKILNLIPKDAIDKTTLLVLTNAIYFKGDWKHEFDSTLTKKKDFTLMDGTIKKANFMYMKKRFNYSENEMFKSIRIPYKGDKQSMIIVLPHHAKNLTLVQNEVGTATFNAVFNYGMPEVMLHLPKFKATIPLTLNDYLKAMGMKLAFSDRATFSNITKENDIKISSVIHKAFIEIDEKGTEAAAATAVVMVQTTSVSHDKIEMPKVFDAKHPFLFYIVDNESKAILFMGRMMKPE